jgi:hypothetical protein
MCLIAQHAVCRIKSRMLVAALVFMVPQSAGNNIARLIIGDYKKIFSTPANSLQKGKLYLPQLMDGCRFVSEPFGSFDDDERRADSQFIRFEQALDGSLNGAVWLISPVAHWPRVVLRVCSRRLMVSRRRRKASKCLSPKRT